MLFIESAYGIPCNRLHIVSLAFAYTTVQFLACERRIDSGSERASTYTWRSLVLMRSFSEVELLRRVKHCSRYTVSMNIDILGFLVLY